MRYTITHQGVPIGTVELQREAEDVTAGDVRPLPAYAALQPAIRAATRALRNLGFSGPVAEPLSAERGATALEDGAVLGRALELWDERGSAVAVDFIDLTDWPGIEPEIVAFVRFREAAAPVAEEPRPSPRPAADGSRPDV